MIAVAATVFEIDASGKMVSGVIGWGSSTFVTPNPRTVTWPSLIIPSATPGMPYSAIFSVTSAAICSTAAADCTRPSGSEVGCGRGDDPGDGQGQDEQATHRGPPVLPASLYSNRGETLCVELMRLSWAPLRSLSRWPRSRCVSTSRTSLSIASSPISSERSPLNRRTPGVRINLARVHAIAYAQKLSTVPSGTLSGSKNAPTVPWTGYFIPPFHQFDVKPASEPDVVAAARGHLTKAITRYREALELEPTNVVAKMGLGWTLSESGDKSGAVAALREVIARAAPEDLKQAHVMVGIRSLTEEATRYLIPLLDPIKDRDEIARLKATADKISQQPRAITPIAVPLHDGLSAADITADGASVAFDVDGSALPQRWSWIRPNAAWLVFDRRDTRNITSGLQLFGSVTFWLFWENGYDALRTLDDNGDGRIAGAELPGVSLWHDRNSDGRSDRDEVRPVAEWGIVSLSCGYEYDPQHAHEIAFSRRGVTFASGATRPTFDLVLTRAPAGQ